MSVQIQTRRDTAANWTSVNPILAQGEQGFETDTGKLKFGDGVSAWNSLPYFLQSALDAKQDLLPNFPNQQVLYGDGTNIPKTENRFRYDTTVNTVFIGNRNDFGSLNIQSNQAQNQSLFSFSGSFNGSYEGNFLTSLAENKSVTLTPSDYGNIYSEIFNQISGQNINLTFSPINTGFGDTAYIDTNLSGGAINVTHGGEYSSNINVDDSVIFINGATYNITNNAKFELSTKGILNKTTKGFQLNVSANANEDADALKTINNVLQGFGIVLDAVADVNGNAEITGIDITSTYISVAPKTTDKYYGIKLSCPQNMGLAQDFFALYSDGGEVFIQSNSADRKNLTLKTFLGQTAFSFNITDETNAVQFAIAGNGRDFILDVNAGTKIGTATNEKLAFWNATPVVQPTAVADASGGATIDTQARTAINAVLARLRTLGLIAT